MSDVQELRAPAAGRLKAGLADPVFDSQKAFRAILNAMSYPGRIHSVDVAVEPPAPLDRATALLALTLFDFDTTIWLDAAAGSSEAPEFLRFHCGCPVTSNPAEAQFGIIADPEAMPGLDQFAIGEEQYPDRSTTLVLQVPSFTEGPETVWSGPGIPKRQAVRISGLPEGFWRQWALNDALYPLGVDLIFCCGSEVIGLPRGVKVEG